VHIQSRRAENTEQKGLLAPTASVLPDAADLLPGGAAAPPTDALQTQLAAAVCTSNQGVQKTQNKKGCLRQLLQCCLMLLTAC
jgi:hypothetical protein